MASATRRRNHKYLGAPWPRISSVSPSTTKQERTKQSRAAHPDNGGSHFVLPLVLNPKSKWVYKHGKLAKALKKSGDR